MTSPTRASRSVDPSLASAGGVMRDAVGAIHNLQHLLGSTRVGPKALQRAVPDVQASCGPMIDAVGAMKTAVRDGPLDLPGNGELFEFVTARVRTLEGALERAREGAVRAAERLRLEAAMAGVVRDLDGALALLDLLVEASADGAVPVDVSDVFRECALRAEAGAPRGGSLSATFEEREPGLAVLVNPRVSLRLLTLAAALAADDRGAVHVAVYAAGASCRFELEGGTGTGKASLLGATPLTPLSGPWAAEAAAASGATLVARPRAVMLTLPRAIPE